MSSSASSAAILSRSSSASSGIGSIDSKVTFSSDNNQRVSQEGGNGDAADRNAGAMPRNTVAFIPPDGGAWAWVVMMSSFLCNGIIFGTINSYGVIFVSLKTKYETLGESEAATKASLIGSLAVGATFALSVVSGVLSDRFGLRRVAVIGAIVAFLGMLISSFVVDHIEVLCFTYGIMFGGGCSLVYTPSLAILGHYFHRRMGIVNGVVTSGSSLFTFIMSFILENLLKTIGLAMTLRFLAGTTFFLVVCSFTFVELMPRVERQNEPGRSGWRKVVNTDNWRNKKYVLWAVLVPTALFGYFVPYVHIVQYVKDILPESPGGKTLLMCIGITSGMGRLIFGKVADHRRVNRIFLQQLSLAAFGACTMLLTVSPHLGSANLQFSSLIVLALVMGIFDGCFIAVLGPVAFDLCGPAGASQGIGFLLGLCSVPLTVGPPVAGLLYDRLGNYTLAFLLAGVSPILGAAFITFIYKVDGVSRHTKEECDLEVSLDDGERQMATPESDNETSERLLNNCSRDKLHTAVTETTIMPQDDDEDDLSRAGGDDSAETTAVTSTRSTTDNSHFQC